MSNKQYTIKVVNDKTNISQLDNINEAIHELIYEYIDNTEKQIYVNLTLNTKSKSKKHDIIFGSIKLITDDDDYIFKFHFGNEEFLIPLNDIKQLYTTIQEKLDETTNYNNVVDKYLIWLLSNSDNNNGNECIKKNKSIKHTTLNTQIKKFPSKKEKEKYENKLKKYLYDKKKVYPNICHDIFVSHKIKSLEDIPIMFRRQFIVFLFMDGKNINGDFIKKSLFDNKNNFEIYDLLLNSMDDSFNDLPTDTYLLNLLEEFSHFIPDIYLPSLDDINKLAEDHDETYKIFKQEVTLVDECDKIYKTENDEDAIDIYHLRS